MGKEVGAWLESRGYGVRRLVQKAAAPGEVGLDLCTPASQGWGDALLGCAAVVHCAAHVHRPVENDAERRLFQAINAEGTRKLLRAARAEGVQRFVFVGTSALYDWSAREPVSEESPVRATTAYGSSNLEADELVRASELDWRIARLGTVFGVGDRANFSRLARGLHSSRFVDPGAGEARESVLPIAKAGELLGRLALNEAAQRLVLNVAAPEAPSLAEICHAFATVCGFREPPRVPLRLLEILARAGDAAAMVKPGFPLTSSVLRKLTTPTVLDVSRMNAAFPEMAWSSFEESLRPAAAYYVTV